MAPQISLIVPTLNRPAHLARLVAQIRGFAKRPDEVLLIDQSRFFSKSDATVDLSDPTLGIRHVHAAFLGPCRARNYGAGLASGEVLWFSDDDMTPDPDSIAFLKRHFDEHPGTFVFGKVRSAASSPVMEGRFDPLWFVTAQVTAQRGSYRPSLGLAAGNLACPRDLFAELGGFDERFDPNGACEDRDLGLRCYYAGVSVLQSSEFAAGHDAADTGGRRESTISDDTRNMHRFWRKYMSRELYDIQAFAYWLSRPRGAPRLVRGLIRLLWGSCGRRLRDRDA